MRIEKHKPFVSKREIQLIDIVEPLLVVIIHYSKIGYLTNETGVVLARLVLGICLLDINMPKLGCIDTR